MGGAVSAGDTNEELVDNLCYEGYINSPSVERVFRLIDRADYMVFDSDDEKLGAYEDRALRKGTLHLSAPCIYTRAMEALKLQPGDSFLNVGSGTGYFSTMAGMLIGPRGVNHGIELYGANVEFARDKLKDVKQNASWYNPLEFCEPKFVEGNGLLLSPSNQQYSKMYCGAAVPEEHAHLLKSLLKVGGVLVMPTDNQLEAVTRVSVVEWNVEVVMPSVTFAPLITPSSLEPNKLTTIEIVDDIKSLKDLCRLSVLTHLTRPSYHMIPLLPLPPPLLDYITGGRQWDMPPEQPKILCPLSKDELQQHAGNDDSGESPVPRHGNHRLSIDRNNRYLLINCGGGVVMQLPLRRRAPRNADDAEMSDDDEADHDEDNDQYSDNYDQDANESDEDAIEFDQDDQDDQDANTHDQDTNAHDQDTNAHDQDTNAHDHDASKNDQSSVDIDMDSSQHEEGSTQSLDSV